MDQSTFEQIQRIVMAESAIVLNPEKEYLVDARLRPICRQRGFEDLNELAKALDQRDPELIRLVVEALTTNETSFFRDRHPFETFKQDILPELIERHSSARTLRIWSGASSSGQEPVSLALILHEHFPELRDWDVRILATDINQQMIDRCSSGYYSELEVSRGLHPLQLNRFFTKSGMGWVLKPEVLNRIEYRQMNLAAPFPPIDRMDVIFLRNVLIYFDEDTKRGILERVSKVLKPDGYLLLGTAESTRDLPGIFNSRNMGRTLLFQRAA